MRFVCSFWQVPCSQTVEENCSCKTQSQLQIAKQIIQTRHYSSGYFGFLKFNGLLTKFEININYLLFKFFLCFRSFLDNRRFHVCNLDLLYKNQLLSLRDWMINTCIVWLRTNRFWLVSSATVLFLVFGGRRQTSEFKIRFWLIRACTNNGDQIQY